MGVVLRLELCPSLFPPSSPLLLCVQSGFHEFLARCDFIDTTTFARNTGAKDSRHKVSVCRVLRLRPGGHDQQCECLGTPHSWRG